MITSASNGRIKYIDTLMQKSKFRKKEGKFVAEGIKMFEEAPESDILEVYVRESSLDMFDADIRKKLEKVSYEVITDAVFKKVCDTVTPQGILTVLKIHESSIEDILSVKDAHIVVLENIQDPGNIGTIIRTSEGAGVTGIILSKDCVDIYNPKVIRSTMGSIYRSRIAVFDDIKEALKVLKDKGVKKYFLQKYRQVSSDKTSTDKACENLVSNTSLLKYLQDNFVDFAVRK